MTKKGINPVKAGLAGAAIVAAGAAAVALSKKENRKKAGKVLNKLKTKGEQVGKKAVKRLDKIIKEENRIHRKANMALAKAKRSAKTKAGISQVGA